MEETGGDVSPPALVQCVTFSSSIFFSVSHSSHFVPAPFFGWNLASEAEILLSLLPICATDGRESLRGLLLPNTLSSCFLFSTATRRLPISPCEILISGSQMGSTRIMSITPDLLIECRSWKNQAKGKKRQKKGEGKRRDGKTLVFNIVQVLAGSLWVFF